MVTTFAPPAVEPDAPPMSIKIMETALPPSVRPDWSKEAKPAVRKVTDWKKLLRIFCGRGIFPKVAGFCHSKPYVYVKEVAQGADITTKTEAEDYLERMERGDENALIFNLLSRFKVPRAIEALVSQKELPIFEKYDEYIPADLLRHAFLVDRLDIDETLSRINDIKVEYFD